MRSVVLAAQLKRAAAPAFLQIAGLLLVDGLCQFFLQDSTI